jgi:hypothetical protein
MGFHMPPMPPSRLRPVPALARLVDDDDEDTLARKVDVYGRDKLGQKGIDELLLHAAERSSVGCVRWLLAIGADANARAPGGETPLGLLARSVRHDCVGAAQALLDAGAAPALSDNSGWTPLDTLIAGPFSESGDAMRGATSEQERGVRFAKLLIDRVDCSRPSPAGLPPLSAAAEGGSAELVRALLPRCDPDQRDETDMGLTPLIRAAWARKVEAAQALAGVSDLQATGETMRCTALQMALGRGNTPSLRPRSVSGFDFGLRQKRTPRELALIDAIASAGPDALAKKALKAFGRDALPALAAAVEREELADSLRPGLAQRVGQRLRAFAALAWRAASRPAPAAEAPRLEETPIEAPAPKKRPGMRL